MNSKAAFTLIEMMVVVLLIGILSALVIPEMKGSFQDALLRSTGRELVNAFTLASSRSVSFNQRNRVHLDRSNGKYFIERRAWIDGEQRFVPLKDVPGAQGKLDSRIAIEVHTPDSDMGDQALGGSNPNSEEDSGAGEQESEGASESVFTFYPDGTADAAEILLTDQQGFRLALQIDSITAHVRLMRLDRKSGSPNTGGGQQ